MSTVPDGRAVDERVGASLLPRRIPAGLPPHLAELERCAVMGIVNVTPDSFSDGGEFADTASAVAHGRELLAQGADLVDIGGESTRPGAAGVGTQEEIRRIVPVVEQLAADGACLSVDTMWAPVAAAAVAAGARIINDVSGGLADPGMAAALARSRTADGGIPVYIAMHWRGHSDVMTRLNHYDDLARDVSRELAERVSALLAAGLDPARLVLDPGLGFSKEGAQNWELLRHLEVLEQLGYPLLVGASRKRFLAPLAFRVVAGTARDRDDATAAISALVASRGTWCVRVHDAAGSAAAVRVAAELSGSATRTGYEHG